MEPVYSQLPTHDTDHKETAEYKERKRNHREVLQRAFGIAIEKIRKGLQYKAEKHKGVKLKRKFQKEIMVLHNEVFTSAGYVSWLRRNEKNDEEIQKFIAHPPPDDQKKKQSIYFDKKLKDLILRETIWTVAEQIRHCPQRINQLFYDISTKNENWYKKDVNPLARWFIRFDPEEQDLEIEMNNLMTPDIDIDQVLDGIKQFKEGSINFDDIDDCGKWNERKFFKTFTEPPGATLFLLLIKYNSGLIQFKIWTVSIVLFLVKYGFKYPSSTLITISDYKVPAIPAFILLDFSIMTLLQIIDWGTRFFVTRQRRLTIMSWSLRMKLGLQLLQPILAISGFLIINYVTNPCNKKEGIECLFVVIDYISVYYIIGRLLIGIIPELFPYSPLTEHEPVVTKNKSKMFRKWKGLRKRYLARIAFFLLLTILSMLYEWWLIVPTINILFTTFYCGDRNSIFSNNYDVEFINLYTQINTQQLICVASNTILWGVTLLAVAIDSGLAFITAMAFVGWIRGYKTQGSSRSTLQINQSTLIKSIAKRFLDDVITIEQDMSKQFSLKKFSKEKSDESSVENYDDTDLESNIMKSPEDTSKIIWEWCVDYWRNIDLISEKEREYLLKSNDIDTILLGSPDAQKHISFFLNTLNVAPAHNYSFKDIPPTTVLIPCYSEKLQFDWTPGPQYSPFGEFSHLVAKFPHEWLNFCERISLQNKCETDEIEKSIANSLDLRPSDPKIEEAVTEWLSRHDQYVYKTIMGSTAYYNTLVELAIQEGGLNENEAKRQSKQKLQVILCMQLYQKRHSEVAPILARWMKEFPCFQVVIDFVREDNMPEEFNQIPNYITYATCLLEWDNRENKVVFRRILPRQYPLRICDKMDRYIQGKAMNQVYGMTFAFGRFVQVLDANQGSHATEYLKFPSLLKDFRLHPQTGTIRYRIIGSREYIFTKNLGTVARCHAYQEWSFGTLVLRTYSDLGIRLHYGHPDVFHGPWASAHSGLSKVNPDINTSEDVFGGFGTMLSNENCKHVEHIQFQKGRETGLANMSAFDTKISQGNSGILRSRDLYHLMERLDFVTTFLLFQGVSGHFTTISLMMWSMRMYIICLFFVSFGGASLKAFGNTTYSTEWLFHAGLTTIIPLIVEFLVEYGPVIGLLQSLFFLPVSTFIYLFQMQTKHEAFIKGIFSGRAAHINTGRGLAIYRSSMIDLFKNYGNTHVYPIIYIIGLTIAYKVMSVDLGGGTLPLIMIYFLCAAVLFSPQIFNPSITGNSISDLGYDMFNFMIWIGKTESRLFLKEVPTYQNNNSLLTYWQKIDLNNLPSTRFEAFKSLFYHFTVFLIWCIISIFFLYAHIQFWIIFYLFFWASTTIIYFFIYWKFQAYEQPLRIILIYLLSVGGMLYFVITYATYGILNFPDLYIAFIVAVKILENYRGFWCDCVVLTSFYKYPSDPTREKEQRENRQIYQNLMLLVLNKLFMVNLARIFMAFIWGVLNFIIALLLRPILSNFFLFGKNINTRSFTYLEPLRKIRKRQIKFGIKL